MKMGPIGPMPWDMVVFLTITTVGFGFSVQKVMHRETPALASSMEGQDGISREMASLSVPSNRTLDLGCLDQRLGNQKVSTQEGAIRVKGKLCHLNRRAMRSFEGVTIKNISNGYEGTIFFHGNDNSFVSDYLVLQTGKNLIQVEWRDSKATPARGILAEVFEK